MLYSTQVQLSLPCTRAEPLNLRPTHALFISAFRHLNLTLFLSSTAWLPEKYRGFAIGKEALRLDDLLPK